MNDPHGLMAALKTAAKIAPGAVVSHVGGTLAADLWPTWPTWAKAAMQLGLGAALSGGLAMARVDPAFAAGPLVGGVTGATHRGARAVQLDQRIAAWVGPSTPATPQVGAGATPQGTPGSQGLYDDARRR